MSSTIFSKSQLLSEEEIEVPEDLLAMSSIKAIKKSLNFGSYSHQYLMELRKRHEEGLTWVTTADMNNIYNPSTRGNNTLILYKLAKGKFIITKMENAPNKISLADGSSNIHVRFQRLWRLTKKGYEYTERFDLSDEELTEKGRKIVLKFVSKNNFSKYCEDITESTISVDWDNMEIGIRILSFKDLANSKNLRESLYRRLRHQKYLDKPTSKVFEEKFKESEIWLKEHLELKTSVITPIGIISLEGNLRKNNMQLNGKRICVIPSLPVHPCDTYICRIQWLNYQIEDLIRLIVRNDVIEECPRCGKNERHGGNLFRQNKWKFCPYCSSNIEDMIESRILDSKYYTSLQK